MKARIGVLQRASGEESVWPLGYPMLSSLGTQICSVAMALPLLLSLTAGAEQIPIRRFTTADGLASNRSNCVKCDSHGFLWFCTAEGLSRFDGYIFVNYGVDQGLPDRYVNDFVETPNGEYWVATARGLARFNPKPARNEPMFVLYRLGENELAQRVSTLITDRHGDIWAATLAGVFRLTKTGERWVSRRIEIPSGDNRSEGPLMEDHAGNIWVVLGGNRLWRRRPDGQLERVPDSFLSNNRVKDLFEDREGRIWAGTYHGLALLTDHAEPGHPVIARVYGKKDGLLDEVAGGMFQSSDGMLWVGGGGLFEVLSDRDGTHASFRLVGRSEQGLAAVDAEDARGNLWMGSQRIARHGFVSYSHSDGLATDDTRSVFEGHDGELYVVTGIHSRYIHRFDGSRFASVAPMIPGYDPSMEYFWGWGQIHFQDRNGQWWIGTSRGLLRYPRVKRLEDLARTPPLAIYTRRDGLDSDDIFRLYEDSRGDVWIAAWGGRYGLTKWERATGRFHVFTDAESWVASMSATFREDRSGDVWVGLMGGGLARYRGGRFTFFTAAQGYPTSGVVSMLLDHAGQLWVGTSRSGLVRIADPTADHPRPITYTTRQGLSSNDVRAIAEDHRGGIYFWTGRGVDRLQPETGAIRHYTEADGLVASGSDHNVAFCDRQGRLWFGLYGLSRLDPGPDESGSTPPLVRITHVRVRGTEYPISELGEADLSGLTLQPDQNQLQIEFASLNFGVGDVIKYQYKLEGADSDWSALSELRTVNYPRLFPGSYRFLVRAVNSDGMASPAPAMISFQQLAPVWRRWWFLTLVALLAASAIYWVYRSRLERLLELERIRTRIASDLHDDVGAGLSQIAILSEVVKRETKPEGSGAVQLLDHMADLSRQLVDSMSDIVWATNPKRDHLRDLAQRMRRFAGDVLAAANVEMAFHVPAQWADASLQPEMRREVFLIFKESINNVARHSRCAHAEVFLDLQGPQLRMKVCDDGQGFRLGQSGDGQGHGLASMEQRARRLGGHLEITSEPGRGTTVTLAIPLAR